jgi:hypothetical protein
MAPHKDTPEGLDHTEPFPARRRATAGDPPKVTRRVLASVFTEDQVLRFAERQLPPGIAHEPTRRLLTEAGIPTGRMTEIDGDVDQVPTIAEWADEDADNVPLHSADLYHLGDLGYGGLCLDGATGAVFHVPEGGGEPDLVNSSLTAFTHFLIEVYGAKDLVENADYDDERLKEFWSRLQAIDPPAFAAEDQYWPVMVDDAQAHGLG